MENEKIEYRVWNPFRSKLAAAVLGGVESIYMPPGSKVLYLGAASGTTVSHVADVVGKVRRCWPLLDRDARFLCRAASNASRLVRPLTPSHPSLLLSLPFLGGPGVRRRVLSSLGP